MMARYRERIRYSFLGPGTKATSTPKYTNALQIVTVIAARKPMRAPTTTMAKTKNSQDGLVGPSVKKVIKAANAMSRMGQIFGSSSEIGKLRPIRVNVVRLYVRCRVKMISEELSIKNHPPLAAKVDDAISVARLIAKVALRKDTSSLVLPLSASHS